MQHFEYQKSKHKIQILKRFYIPLGLFALAGFYIAWTLNTFSWPELWSMTRSALIVFGPLLLLGLAVCVLHYWISQFRQSHFPTLSIGDDHLSLKDGNVLETVSFDDMHSIRLIKAGSTREAIQIILKSGQNIVINSNFPIASIKPILNQRLDCKLM
tara:strand:- start:507 stop:977 length:471 start_codon:yes stop_codon:yes gene_type:complete